MDVHSQTRLQFVIIIITNIHPCLIGNLLFQNIRVPMVVFPFVKAEVTQGEGVEVEMGSGEEKNLLS